MNLYLFACFISADAPSSCKSDEFQCVKDGSCVKQSWKCDKEKDCPDASDEMNCGIVIFLKYLYYKIEHHRLKSRPDIRLSINSFTNP